MWSAWDSKLNICITLKVMIAGSTGEREFLNQQMLKEASHLKTSYINLYKDTFLLTSPYYAAETLPTIFHRVLVLPLEELSLGETVVRFDRPLRSGICAAKSVLEAMHEPYQAGFVHSGRYSPCVPPERDLQGNNL